MVVLQIDGHAQRVAAHGAAVEEGEGRFIPVVDALPQCRQQHAAVAAYCAVLAACAGKLEVTVEQKNVIEVHLCVEQRLFPFTYRE